MPETYEAKKARRQSVADAIAEFKKTLSCELCGESEPCCLDFHHRDPAEKTGSVALMCRSGHSLDRIFAEIEKCAVLCANCHRKLHAGVVPW